jgi:hypothetical protein
MFDLKLTGRGWMYAPLLVSGIGDLQRRPLC